MTNSLFSAMARSETMKSQFEKTAKTGFTQSEINAILTFFSQKYEDIFDEPVEEEGAE